MKQQTLDKINGYMPLTDEELVELSLEHIRCQNTYTTATNMDHSHSRQISQAVEYYKENILKDYLTKRVETLKLYDQIRVIQLHEKIVTQELLIATLRTKVFDHSTFDWYLDQIEEVNNIINEAKLQLSEIFEECKNRSWIVD